MQQLMIITATAMFFVINWAQTLLLQKGLSGVIWARELFVKKSSVEEFLLAFDESCQSNDLSWKENSFLQCYLKLETRRHSRPLRECLVQHLAIEQKLLKTPFAKEKEDLLFHKEKESFGSFHRDPIGVNRRFPKSRQYRLILHCNDVLLGAWPSDRALFDMSLKD